MPMQRLHGHAENHFSGKQRKIWFIRHGQSEAHVGKATTYIEGVRLTQLGRDKADNIAGLLPRTPNLIITSPYLRAWETALPTRQRFPYTPHETWPEVQEFTYLGSLAGQCLTKQERSNQVQAYWKRGDPVYKDDNGESFAEFIYRTRAVLQRLQEQEGFIVIFTHEQFIRAIQSVLDGWMEPAPDPLMMHRFRERLLSEPLPFGYILEMFAYPESWKRPIALFEPRLPEVNELPLPSSPSTQIRSPLGEKKARDRSK